jgi:hypothetical protein
LLLDLFEARMQQKMEALDLRNKEPEENGKFRLFRKKMKYKILENS